MSEMTLDEKARAAYREASKMKRGLQSVARVLTADPTTVVEFSAGTPSTNGHKINLRVPMELGDLPAHEADACQKRDSDGIQRCKRCEVLETIQITLIHEIAHIVHKTFTNIPAHEAQEVLTRALEVECEGKTDGSRAAKLKAYIESAPDVKKRDYLNLLDLVSRFLPTIFNATEDMRVNNLMMEDLPGTRVMFDALTTGTMRDGVLKPDGTRFFWRDAEPNIQAIIGVFCKVSGLTYKDWLASPIVEALDDPGLTAVCDEVKQARTARQVYRLCLPLLENLRRLGFCKAPDEPEDEPQPEPEEEPQPEENKDEEDSDSGEQDDAPDQGSDDGGDDHDDDDQDSPSGDDQSDEASGGASPDGDDEDAGPRLDGDADEAEGEGVGDDTPAPEEEDDDAEGDSSGEEQEGSGGQEPGEDDPGVPDGDDDDASDLSASESEDGGDSEADDDDTSSSESGESDARDSDGDMQSDLPEGGLEEPEGDADSADGESGSEADDESNDQAAEPSGDSAGSPDSEGDEAVEDGQPGGDESTGEDASPGSTDTGPESSEPAATPPPGPSADDDGAGPQEAAQGPLGDGKDTVEETASEPIPYTEEDLERDGTPEDVERLLNMFGGHADKNEDTPTPNWEEEEAIERAINQVDHFDRPSRNVDGVKILRYDERDPDAWRSAWSDERHMSSDDVEEVSERILSAALQRLRLAFQDNKKAHVERHKKSGRIDTRVLGKRIATGDERLFHKTRQPGKKDYFVVIGLDVSGSTSAAPYDRSYKCRLDLMKAACMAKCELLNRLDIPFAVYAHSGSDSLEIFVIKEEKERWTDATREALSKLQPYSCNLDGHTMEFYRKVAQKSRATDRLILYYTDGAMPAENYEEELEILEVEIEMCKRLNIRLIAIGVENDDPTEYGLDMIRLDGLDDIRKVVDGLRLRLQQ